MGCAEFILWLKIFKEKLKKKLFDVWWQTNIKQEVILEFKHYEIKAKSFWNFYENNLFEKLNILNFEHLTAKTF